MTESTPTQPVLPVDSRLVEFSYASDCDINAMKAAMALLKRDPSVIDLLGTVRSTDELNIDFNHDKNIRPNGQPAASNREWASALIAVAQLSREQGLPADKLKVQDIIDRGQCIYDTIKDMETGKTAAVCKTESRTR